MINGATINLGALNDNSQKGLYLLVPLPDLSIQVSKLTGGGNRVTVEMKAVPGKSYRPETSAGLKTCCTGGDVLVAAENHPTTEGPDAILYFFLSRGRFLEGGRL